MTKCKALIVAVRRAAGARRIVSAQAKLIANLRWMLSRCWAHLSVPCSTWRITSVASPRGVTSRNQKQTCGAEYKVVRIERHAVAPEERLTFRKCGGPAPWTRGREPDRCCANAATGKVWALFPQARCTLRTSNWVDELIEHGCKHFVPQFERVRDLRTIPRPCSR